MKQLTEAQLRAMLNKAFNLGLEQAGEIQLDIVLDVEHRAKEQADQIQKLIDSI